MEKPVTHCKNLVKSVHRVRRGMISSLNRRHFSRKLNERWRSFSSLQLSGSTKFPKEMTPEDIAFQKFIGLSEGKAFKILAVDSTCAKPATVNQPDFATYLIFLSVQLTVE